MHILLDEINLVRVGPVKATVSNRLREFEALGERGRGDWFSELCFCILTANSRADTAIAIQGELGPKGFQNASVSRLSSCIKGNGHRFHNNKAKFIAEARAHKNIKSTVQRLVSDCGEEGAREWLAKNVKGIGFKEASHFLRNVGYKKLAILDRHILNLMVENGLIAAKPKTLSKANYLEFEEKFRALASRVKMFPAELDLFMWYMKTGKVLK